MNVIIKHVLKHQIEKESHKFICPHFPGGMMTMLMIDLLSKSITRQQPGQNSLAYQQFTLEEPLDQLPVLDDDFWRV